MSLFHFGRKKEEKKPDVTSCCCSGAGSGTVAGDGCSAMDTSEIKNIKVLGAGCKSCHEQYEYAKQAVKEMGPSIEVEYITDMQKVMEYGVMSMPAFVVNEKVMAMGKVLKVKDVISLFNKQEA